MFNVLPESLKQHIHSEYNLRRLIVIASAILFLQVSFLIMLLPSWIEATRMERGLTRQVEIAAEVSESESVMDVMTKTNRTLTLVEELRFVSMTAFINSVLDKSNRVHIDGISYSASDQAGAITISGMTDTREALVSYAKNLEASGRFASVNLPISNLAKDTNIPFTIRIVIR